MSRASAHQSVFHAIADPTRRAILDLLREAAGPGDEARRTVLAMLERLQGTIAELGQSAFSQHLAVLRKAGLVTVKKAGRARVYALEPGPLREIAGWIGAYDAFWTEKFDNLGRYLDAQKAAGKKAKRRGG